MNVNSQLFKFLRDVKYVVTSKWSPQTGMSKRYPKVVQLPMTYLCNSRCVMCNIWKMDYSNEFDLGEFRKFLSDPIYKKVKALGINGGEPSLVKNLPEYAKVMLELPSLKYLNIISHGFNHKPLFPALKEIYATCKEKGVKFHVSISLDGYGEIHDIVRGKKVFQKVDYTIKEIIENQHLYCDSYDLGCTVIRHNVDFMIELDEYAKLNDFNIKYRVGIENKRIESNKLLKEFSVLMDSTLQSSAEFFHSRYFEANRLIDKFKYYALFYFLTAEKRKRLLGCDWKEDGVTMDSRGDFYYCAVESDKIGSLREEKGEDIFFKKDNLKYRSSILKDKCNDCIHDYNGKPEFKNLMVFFKEVLHQQFYWLSYYFKTRFS